MFKGYLKFFIVFVYFVHNSIRVADATTAADIEDWDSLAHMSLVSSVEEAFGIEFSLGEINGFKNVGEMMDAIEKRLG